MNKHKLGQIRVTVMRYVYEDLHAGFARWVSDPNQIRNPLVFAEWIEWRLLIRAQGLCLQF
jgi:hypothetical protein